MAVWRLQVNTGGANVADYCLQNHVAALWAGKVLAYLMGNYYDSKATYEKLFDWIDEHKFKTGKYSYKEAVIDELATASPSEYLTKISIQVFYPCRFIAFPPHCLYISHKQIAPLPAHRKAVPHRKYTALRLAFLQAHL